MSLIDCIGKFAQKTSSEDREALLSLRDENIKSGMDEAAADRAAVESLEIADVQLTRLNGCKLPNRDSRQNSKSVPKLP